jgi:hypothetical protein
MPAAWTRPADVRETVRKRLATLLSGFAAGDEQVPFAVPVRGPGPAEIGERLAEAQKWAGEWEQAARGPLRVEYKEIGGRSFGRNRIPCRAWVDGYDQAWALLGARADAARVAALVDQTKARCPALVPWLVRRPVKALALSREWDRLLATVCWMDEHDVSRMYPRQVDVPGVDTKFIEQHKGVLAELLDLQLAPDRVNGEADGFEERYGFRRKPGYVRLRLGAGLPVSAGFTELMVRVDELTAAPPGTARVYVVENETTYLAFPLPADAIVIFGGGYAIGLLEPLAWLADLDVVYWGDIDTHGFAILSRLRRRFPRLRSMLMDRGTLLAHRSQWVTESVPTTGPLEHLTADERQLYDDLVAGELAPAVRLEQERVSFTAIRQATGGRG